MLRPAYPAFTKQQEDAISRYTDDLVKKVVATIGEALADLQPADVSFGQGLAGFGVNRRRVRLRNLPGPVDQDVPVLSVRQPSGKLRAILFGYACHNTSLGDYRVNGDWAGFAQHELEQRYPGALACFVQGCGADINPIPRYQGNDPVLSSLYCRASPDVRHRSSAAAVAIALDGGMQRVSGPLSAALRTVDLPFHHIPTREEFESPSERQERCERVSPRHAEQMLSHTRSRW